MVRIAFGYKQRVGKDTSCDYLIKKYGGIKLSFAGHLYEILNFSQDVCKFEKVKDRKFLQFIGTEWARTINNDVWVDLMIDKIKKIDKNENIFVSDLRFKNEFKVLQDHGFINVQIKNPNDILLYQDGFDNHQSDIDLNDSEWDYTIDNFSTLEDLYAQLDHLMRSDRK